MRLTSGQQLGYCTNVHPYEDLTGLVAALESGAAPLRERLVRAGRLAPDAPLGVGLWLPARVAAQVAHDPLPLRRRLDALRLSCFTVNAFPYGDFHGARVKDAVFRPTWAERSRLDYTLLAAQALAALLPEGQLGSISTHSGGYKPWGAAAPRAQDIATHLLAAAEGLADLRRRTGRHIRLCLEPEPLSTLETTDEVVDFFARWLQPAGGAARSEAATEHLGVCFDACHQAVEFEDMQRALAALASAGIAVGKLQLSSAIRVERPDAARAALQGWADERWFHQVVARAADGRVRRQPDLPEALAEPLSNALTDAPTTPQDSSTREAWRIHFHVPLFATQLDEQGLLLTTQPDLQRLLQLAADPALTPHLEIETYSWSMIPSARRAALGVPTLLDCLEREFAWVLDRLGER